ncbi:dihydrofolate reductase [Evansella sp. AB-P1]|uniref:dihydrofolate reductase n=1 Tax=Evansella sp. AB-P1 TaxID=3037653 RepID=UPI00241C7FF2|nr:dihydrofolate reductase [Evansella sp. AB-P1]MDG5788911.1 dihydrofolate reductase [Evansella sp. AB-P1]
MISMIVAMGENNVIGLNGDMPWHIPNDLKYFKRVTSGHSVIMGRKTYESIGKPLPNRRNFVITHNQAFSVPGVEVCHSLQELDQLVTSNEEIFVIGGATIYKELLPKADRLYITKIHDQFEGDTYFPQFKEEEWKIVSMEQGTVDEKNKYPHTFLIYERK